MSDLDPKNISALGCEECGNQAFECFVKKDDERQLIIAIRCTECLVVYQQQEVL